MKTTKIAAKKAAAPAKPFKHSAAEERAEKGVPMSKLGKAHQAEERAEGRSMKLADRFKAEASDKPRVKSAKKSSW